jgi:hypothetical protein
LPDQTTSLKSQQNFSMSALRDNLVAQFFSVLTVVLRMVQWLPCNVSYDKREMMSLLERKPTSMVLHQATNVLNVGGLLSDVEEPPGGLTCLKTWPTLDF